MSSEEFARKLTAKFLEIAELLEMHLVNEGSISEEPTEEDEDDVSIFTSLLQSTAGEKLAAYTIQIQSFVIKGIFLMFPFGDFINTLKELYEDPEYRDLITQAGVNENVLDSIVQSMNDKSNEFDAFFDKDDERIFLASLISLLHTCVERYTLDLAKEVLADDSVIEGIAKAMTGLNFSLEDVKLILDNPENGLRDQVMHHFSNEVSNPYTRLDIILNGLGFKKIVENSMTATNLHEYRNLFKEFVKLRNKVIHNEPLPKIEKYENWFIRENLEKIRKQFESGFQDAEIPLTSMKSIFEVFLKWFKAHEKALAIAMQAPIMAIVYPALIDITVSLMMESK